MGEKVKVWKIEERRRIHSSVPLCAAAELSRVEHFVITRFLCKSQLFRCYRRSQMAWKAFAASALVVFRRNMLGSQPSSVYHILSHSRHDCQRCRGNSTKFRKARQNQQSTFPKSFFAAWQSLCQNNFISQISARRESIFFYGFKRQCCEHEIEIQFPRRWTLNFYYKSIKNLLFASCEDFLQRKKRKTFRKAILQRVTRRVAIFISCGFSCGVKSCLLVKLLMQNFKL